MVDPTALNEQKRQNKKEAQNARAFLFSLLGALTGAAVCVLADCLFIKNITGILYVFPGMTAYAFYLYFVERKDQKNMHMLFVALSCVIATVLAVFISTAILYAPAVPDGNMNFIQKTFELYRVNISQNGFTSEKYYTGVQEHPQYSLSLIAFHVICAVMSLVGLMLSWLFVKFVGGSWEKKHGKQDYSYSGRTRKNKKKGKRRR